MDGRERKQALFRDLNERVREAAVAQGVDGHVFEFVCECSNLDCTLRLRLSLEAYEQAREDPGVFLLAPGHERRGVEQVLARFDEYRLVRRPGGPLGEVHDLRGSPRSLSRGQG